MIAVLGIYIAFSSARSVNNINLSNSSSLEILKNSISQSIFNQIDCGATMLPSGLCTPGALLELKKVNIAAVTKVFVEKVPSAPTKFGALTVRAECSPTGDRVLVRALLLNNGAYSTSLNPNDYKADPLTKKKHLANNKDSLIIDQTYGLCKKALSSAGVLNPFAKANCSPFTYSSYNDGVACPAGDQYMTRIYSVIPYAGYNWQTDWIPYGSFWKGYTTCCEMVPL